MRLLVLSDLHHELWREQAPKITPERSCPDLVILAGDINTNARAVSWASSTFQDTPVLYVHGNHEGYGHNIDEVQVEIRAACQATTNVHFLNCDEFVYGGIRFLGATLWTDFKLFGDDERQSSMREAEAALTDYKRIRLAKMGYRKLRAADTARFHAFERSWLSKKLDEPFAGPTVVITHMAPSVRSVPAQFEDSLTSAAYASALDGLIEKAELWVHGHMHEQCDYVIGGCRVVCNPCGYKTRSGETENPSFDPNFIVEVHAQKKL